MVGLDLPQAGGTLRPALDPVKEVLDDPLVDRVLELADRVTSGSGAGVRWAQLSEAEQDAITAGLARLRIRAHALGADEVTQRRIEAAVVTDYMWRATANMATTPYDLSARERFLADSVHWHLRSGGRIVLAAHNNHIMKTELDFGGGIKVLPMGSYLARELARITKPSRSCTPPATCPRCTRTPTRPPASRCATRSSRLRHPAASKPA